LNVSFVVFVVNIYIDKANPYSMRTIIILVKERKVGGGNGIESGTPPTHGCSGRAVEPEF
jgi:hypothetical protein